MSLDRRADELKEIYRRIKGDIQTYRRINSTLKRSKIFFDLKTQNVFFSKIILQFRFILRSHLGTPLL